MLCGLCGSLRGDGHACAVITRSPAAPAKGSAEELRCLRELKAACATYYAERPAKRNGSIYRAFKQCV